MHQQTNIYDLLGERVDPVYEILSNLKKGESVNLKDMNVFINEFGLYELSNDYWHECFRDSMECYKFICFEVEKEESDLDDNQIQTITRKQKQKQA